MPKLPSKQRKLIRQAKKEQRFNIRREKERNKNRARKYTICFMFLGFGLTVSIICLMILFPLYADFKYQTSINYLEIPDVIEPCYVKIEITYQSERPEKIQITNDKIPVTNIDIIDDFANKKLTLGFDTDILSDKYVLAILPEDNFELKYKITKEPSYKYIIYDKMLYRDDKDNLWLDFITSFRRVPSEMRCVIQGRGPKYTPIIFETSVKQNKRYCLNLTELAKQQKIDLSKCNELTLSISIDKSSTDLFVPSIYENITLEQWPAYNATEYHSFSLDDTQHYIRNLH